MSLDGLGQIKHLLDDAVVLFRGPGPDDVNWCNAVGDWLRLYAATPFPCQECAFDVCSRHPQETDPRDELLAEAERLLRDVAEEQSSNWYERRDVLLTTLRARREATP